MTTQTRSKLSIAFTIYNKARTQARRRGETQEIDRLNKVLGRMVSQAYKH